MMTEILVYDKLFIGGRWVAPAGNERIEVVSPATEQVIAQVPHASVSDVDRAVAVAREAFDRGPWPRLTPAERIAVVSRIKDGLFARRKEIAELITRQNGSPISFARGGQAVAPVVVFDAMIAAANQLAWEERRGGLAGPVLVRREPVGVVAAITPWNVPLFTAAAKVAPALLAGCPVILKPSPETPLDAYLLAEVCAEAGLPEGVLSVLPADRETSAYLAAHPGIDKIAFTGSVAAGKAIMAAAAKNLTRVTLELGGKSAGIVLADADLDAALPQLVSGAFVNSGEACVALTRILAPAARYDEVAARLTDAVSALKVGDPMDPSTQIGPLVTRRQQQRNLEYVHIGRQEGATVLVGGGVPEDRPVGWYVQPTLFGDVTSDMRIAREEIFGPVICLIRYEDEADAVRIANDSDFGLAGTVFAGTTERGTEIARQIRTGTFAVNCQRFELGQPFGGYKNSGIGREFGVEGLSAYLEYKTIALPQAV
jgi:acyl-CoA reductase-like NAD-dependent aldehyde dehydrogenase